MSVSNNSKHKCLLLTQESINFSPSKMSHSFAKDKRFNSISGHKYEKSEFTHTMKSTFGRRSPSFGVGDRFKVRRNENPPPGNYKTLSSFESTNRATMPKTNYYTFGSSASRDQNNKVYNPMDNSPRGTETRQIPGPGAHTYNNNSFGTEGRRFSFLQKTKYS